MFVCCLSFSKPIMPCLSLKAIPSQWPCWAFPSQFGIGLFQAHVGLCFSKPFCQVQPAFSKTRGPAVFSKTTEPWPPPGKHPQLSKRWGRPPWLPSSVRPGKHQCPRPHIPGRSANCHQKWQQHPTARQDLPSHPHHISSSRFLFQDPAGECGLGSWHPCLPGLAFFLWQCPLQRAGSLCSFFKPARLFWLTTSSFSKVLCQSTTTTGFSKPLVALPWVVLPWHFSKSLGLDFSKSWAGLLFFFLPSFSKVAVGFSKPEEELAAAAGVSTAFLGWPLLPLCLVPPALGSSEVESCSNFLATAFAILSWHLAFAFSKASRCLARTVGSVGSAFSKADHCIPFLLSFLAWEVVPWLPPLFVGGPFRLVHLFQDFPVQGRFSNPLGFSKPSLPKPCFSSRAFPSPPTATSYKWYCSCMCWLWSVVTKLCYSGCCFLADLLLVSMCMPVQVVCCAVQVVCVHVAAACVVTWSCSNLLKHGCRHAFNIKLCCPCNLLKHGCRHAFNINKHAVALWPPLATRFLASTIQPVTHPVEKQQPLPFSFQNCWCTSAALGPFPRACMSFSMNRVALFQG